MANHRPGRKKTRTLGAANRRAEIEKGAVTSLVFASNFNMKRTEYIAGRRETAQHSIDELIDLLSADDLQTRFLAEMCLRDATST